MSAGTEQARQPQTRTGSEGAALVWLDAMVGGICTPETFLQVMREQYPQGDEDSWEIFSLLDQYYRRGKIQPELFQSLKRRLENSALGPETPPPAVKPQPVPKVSAKAAPAAAAKSAAVAKPAAAKPGSGRPAGVKPGVKPGLNPGAAHPAAAHPGARPAGARIVDAGLADAAPPGNAHPGFAHFGGANRASEYPGPAPGAADPFTEEPDAAEPAGDKSATPQTAAAQRSAAEADITQPIMAAEPFVSLRPPAAAAAPRDASATTTDARREVAAGDVLLSRYRLLTPIGEGSTGTVFEALDEYRLDLPITGRSVAVKVLNASVAESDELLMEAQRQFQQMQLLSHPNVVRVHEFERDGNIAFLTMELLNGVPLSRVFTARNGVALARTHALAVMRDVGEALAYAHSRRILHGDICPHNVFITNEGDLRVMDFAVSHRQLQERWSEHMELSKRSPVAAPGYASCQSLAGQSPDSRDDVFALACLSYVLLAGRHPFPNLSSIEAYAQGIKLRRPPRLSGRQWHVLREGLQWERERRPADVGDWLARFDLTGAALRLPSLSTLVNAAAPRRRNWLLRAAAVVLLACAAAVGYWAATDYDSLSSHVADWSEQVTSAIDRVASPAATAPAAAAPATSAPATSVPATSAPSAPAPTATTPSASTPSTTAPAGTGRAIDPAHPVVTPTRTAVAPAAATPPTPVMSATASRAPQAATSAPASAMAPSFLQGAKASAQATNVAARNTPARASATGVARTEQPRIEFAADTVNVPASAASAQVTVLRTGSAHGKVAFSWWTESGTAKPSVDFAPVVPRVEHIDDGQGSVSLTIPVARTERSHPKSFYVVIDRTDTGAALGKRTLTMVTLQPN